MQKKGKTDISAAEKTSEFAEMSNYLLSGVLLEDGGRAAFTGSRRRRRRRHGAGQLTGRMAGRVVGADFLQISGSAESFMRVELPPYRSRKPESCGDHRCRSNVIGEETAPSARDDRRSVPPARRDRRDRRAGVREESVRRALAGSLSLVLNAAGERWLHKRAA